MNRLLAKLVEKKHQQAGMRLEMVLQTPQVTGDRGGLGVAPMIGAFVSGQALRSTPALSSRTKEGEKKRPYKVQFSSNA